MTISHLTLQFGTNLDEIPDPTIEYMYEINPDTISEGFTHLMKLVLCTAAHPEAIDLIKCLDTADINTSLKNGLTALHIAAINLQGASTSNTIQLLVDLNADVDCKDKCGYTALHYAFMNLITDVNVIKILIDASDDINSKTIEGYTILHTASALSDDPNIIKRLIDKNADVNSLDNNGYTALYTAIDNTNCSSIIKLLINANTNINIQPSNEPTILQLAIRRNIDIDVIKLLVSNADNYNKNTALYEAIAKNNMDLVSLLINSCININYKNNCGYTALHFSIGINKNLDIINLLINANSDVNTLNFCGQTPLYTILRDPLTNINKQIIYALINAGANIMQVLEIEDNEYLRSILNIKQNRIKRASNKYNNAV